MAKLLLAPKMDRVPEIRPRRFRSRLAMHPSVRASHLVTKHPSAELAIGRPATARHGMAISKEAKASHVDVGILLQSYNAGVRLVMFGSMIIMANLNANMAPSPMSMG